MKVLIDVAHPAHVHFFKNTIWKLEEKGHVVRVTAKNKEVTLQLLEKYGFRYIALGKPKKGLINKAFSLLEFDYRTYKAAKEFKPDLFVSLNSPYMAHVSRIMRKPHIAFEDTEDAYFVFLLSNPFTDVICTPSCFKKDFGKKHVRFNGYKELAYLHPSNFKPDKAVLDELGIEEERYIVLRFISWMAHHDTKLKGIGEARDMINALETYGRVLITSEAKLKPELEKYRINCSPDKMHSLLYYAGLYIGEGGTMATESAVLGTPSIHIEANDKGEATGNFYGNFVELRDVYGLMHFYPNEKEALKKAIEILDDPHSKAEWQKKRERLLADKIDVSAWMTDFIERYPESFNEYKRNKK